MLHRFSNLQYSPIFQEGVGKDGGGGKWQEAGVEKGLMEYFLVYFAMGIYVSSIL